VRGRVWLRVACEVLFIVGVAVAVGFAGLATWVIIVVMAGAWLLVATLEWAVSRAEAAPGPPAAELEEAPVPVPAEQPPAERHVRVLPRHEPEPEPVGAEPEAEPQVEPEPEPQMEPEPEPQPQPVAAEPQREAEAEPQPQPQLEVVPPPKREPAPEPELQPQVVQLGPHTSRTPREWNLWELERLARERSGDDAVRDEEWQFLFMYLRDFADPNGVLPATFDGLVRESFPELIALR
jgi:hypothetical protein